MTIIKLISTTNAYSKETLAILEFWGAYEWDLGLVWYVLCRRQWGFESIVRRASSLVGGKDLIILFVLVKEWEGLNMNHVIMYNFSSNPWDCPITPFWVIRSLVNLIIRPSKNAAKQLPLGPHTHNHPSPPLERPSNKALVLSPKTAPFRLKPLDYLWYCYE